jgi:excisionase family DNA binding protein
MARAAPTLEDWLTTDEVAERYGVQPRMVLRMIREKRLVAVKKGWVWLVHRTSLPTVWPPPRNDV